MSGVDAGGGPGVAVGMSYQALERRRTCGEYRDAVLAYRAAVAEAEDFSRLRTYVDRVERARRKIKLSDDRRAVEQELA